MKNYFRIDRFTGIPASGRPELLEVIVRTHQVLSVQRGFIRDYILEHVSDDQTATIFTLVQWESHDNVARAAQEVATLHKSLGLKILELLKRLGVTMERGSYQALEEESAASFPEHTS